MCNTGNILCEYYHILVHIILNLAAIQLRNTLLECLVTCSFSSRCDELMRAATRMQNIDLLQLNIDIEGLTSYLSRSEVNM